MSEVFSQGHALIVGVGADLAATVDDAKGIAQILSDPERCAYPPEQVTLLTEAAANRAGVLQKLDELAQRTDAESTVIVYFSGHGYQVKVPGVGKLYFLMPHGYNVSQLDETAISGDEFTRKLKAIPAKKLVVLLDCCHAGGVGDAKAPTAFEFSKAPLPPQAREALSQGSGQVLIASSKEDELSFAGRPYSAFTLALVEAFSGAGVAKKDGYVRVADLALYAREMVPQRTRQRQHPVLDFEKAENFPLAYYAAGGSEPKSLTFEMEPVIEPEPGAWQGHTDQRGQVVHGPQTNIDGDVHGNVFSGEQHGGVQIGSINTGEGGKVNVAQRDIIQHETRNINTGGGEFIGRDQTNIRDSQGIVIGDHNRVTMSPQGGGDPLSFGQAFARIRREIAALESRQDREEASHAVEMLEDEARQGDAANESRVRRWLAFLEDMAPEAWEVAVDTFLQPVQNVSPVFQQIAERARTGRGR